MIQHHWYKKFWHKVALGIICFGFLTHTCAMKASASDRTSRKRQPEASGPTTRQLRPRPAWQQHSQNADNGVIPAQDSKTGFVGSLSLIYPTQTVNAKCALPIYMLAKEKKNALVLDHLKGDLESGMALIDFKLGLINPRHTITYPPSRKILFGLGLADDNGKVPSVLREAYRLSKMQSGQ